MVDVAPSELVFFHGEEFASRSLFGNVDLPHTDSAVSARELGRYVLVVALLANERRECIRLVPGKTKRTFGLRRRGTLFVEAGPGNLSWPSGSIEARIQEFVNRHRRSPGADRTTVSRLVYHLFSGDSPAPWLALISMIESGLAGRGLLRVEQRAGGLSTTYRLPEEAERRLRDRSIGPVWDLLETTRSTRRQTWRRLRREVERGVDARTSFTGPLTR